MSDRTTIREQVADLAPCHVHISVGRRQSAAVMQCASVGSHHRIPTQVLAYHSDPWLRQVDLRRLASVHWSVSEKHCIAAHDHAMHARELTSSCCDAVSW